MYLNSRKPIENGVTSLCRRAATIALAVLVLAVAAIVVPTHLRASDLDSAGGSNTGSRFVRIGLNKSVVIKLPAKARDVLVGNPDIVDAVIRTKNTAYLFARAVGQTNVFFFDANGQQVL